MQELISGLQAFLASGGLRLDLLGRLVLATVLGGLVGLEREMSGKPAGLRTNILICVGATLLTDLSVNFPSFTVSDLVRADPARIAAQIVSGIGFLGAGTIIQARGSVTGLTTAATLWVVAAIGIAVGSGFHVEAVGSTFLVLVALVPLGRLEGWLHRRRSTRNLRMTADFRPGVVDDLEALLEDAGLEIALHEVTRDAARGRVSVDLDATGSRDAFRRARARLVAADDVRSFSVGGHRD
ncbi:MAG TPA: MgtC/SapB family protein [Longimicrobiales bacterium]|nr:MgtC/SapB family protein [Longimicrobiales bacterium]